MALSRDVKRPNTHESPVVQILQESVNETIKNLSSQKIGQQQVEIGRLSSRLASREQEIDSLRKELESLK